MLHYAYIVELVRTENKVTYVLVNQDVVDASLTEHGRDV
jgi:hypothetical protein